MRVYNRHAMKLKPIPLLLLLPALMLVVVACGGAAEAEFKTVELYNDSSSNGGDLKC
jgi:hypothetical protein